MDTVSCKIKSYSQVCGQRQTGGKPNILQYIPYQSFWRHRTTYMYLPLDDLEQCCEQKGRNERKEKNEKRKKEAGQPLNKVKPYQVNWQAGIDKRKRRKLFWFTRPQIYQPSRFRKQRHLHTMSYKKIASDGSRFIQLLRTNHTPFSHSYSSQCGQLHNWVSLII